MFYLCFFYYLWYWSFFKRQGAQIILEICKYIQSDPILFNSSPCVAAVPGGVTAWSRGRAIKRLFVEPLVSSNLCPNNGLQSTAHEGGLAVTFILRPFEQAYICLKERKTDQMGEKLEIYPMLLPPLYFVPVLTDSLLDLEIPGWK